MISVALIGKKQGLTYQSIQLDMGGMYRSNRGSDMSGTLVYPTVSYVGMLGTTSGKARTARYIPVRYIPVRETERLPCGERDRGDVIVLGYNDKMRILLETIVGRIEQFEVKPDRFSVIKVSYSS
ncbi:hypothetical protein BHE74_00001034 [Ensete ventricosum]|nr:hypothetical protein GW17_00011533 [Ensete ventricosum]RWW89875.1 hypothetical protein BHE74_00001034 [Ensete ventricosum]